ncbi:NUDIX domain-containing protein [Stenotrophomonas geniculata]|uniref:NUDIX domain-containing protein n=1 Tax=Stenotrophomonas geniculata TaxID=86188 RepID=UPI00383AAEDB
MRQRVIVCPLIQNQGAYLLCRMPLDRGAFPGQWALSGGGLEPDERIHMIYLIFDCEALNRDVTINEEFDAHAWVEPKDLGAYDVNAATRITLLAKGLLSN